MRCGVAEKPPPKGKRRFGPLWHRGLRARIESCLRRSLDYAEMAQFQIEETRARSVWGVMTSGRGEAASKAYMAGFLLRKSFATNGFGARR